MTQQASELSSGKNHTDENFPVASVLIHPRHRAVILAFYRFARAADDVADSPTASADEKLRLLGEMENSLVGVSGGAADAVALRHALAVRSLPVQHALDLLKAFRRDVTKLRYNNWIDLMDYCRYSAMPVGRFVLDVHGEDHAIWAYSDALCAALQVINHLQDCGKDYRALDRVYLPLDILGRAGIGPEALADESASPALLGVLSDLVEKTDDLLAKAKPFSMAIADYRLGLEVNVIQSLAESLNRCLAVNDPLSERVHHNKIETLGLAIAASTRYMLTRRSINARPVLRL